MRNSPLAPITVWGMERSHALARSIRFPLSFLFLSSLYLFLSSRPEIKKYLISKLRARDQSLFFALPFISFFFSSFPFHLFFSPAYPPIALQRGGDDVSIHAFTLISPPYLVLLAFHPYVEDVPILVVSQPNGSYEILRHRFPPGNRVFSIQGREFNSTIL